MGKGNFFLRTTFSGRGQNMVRVQKWMFFWGPKSWFLAKKSNFCHTTPILDNGPFVALGETVHFLPWELFFDFAFLSYSCFRKKKPVNGWRVKKSSPSPLWGHCLPVTALALSARGLENWPSFSSSLNRLLEGRQIGIMPNPGSGSRGLSNLRRAMSLISFVLKSLKSGLNPLWTTTRLTPLSTNRTSKMLPSGAAAHFQYRKENWLLANQPWYSSSKRTSNV